MTDKLKRRLMIFLWIVGLILAALYGYYNGYAGATADMMYRYILIDPSGVSYR